MENWTLTWTRLTSLNEETINAIESGLPGVYRLSYKSLQDGSYYVFYVGRAEDLKQRLLAHLSPTEENVCIKNYLEQFDCYFRYAIVENEKVRGAAEKQMFKQYQPVCNISEPDGPEDIQVNLD
ncbi:hypothetical protein A2774_03145 [Candidatus Roizmanbacteria bacterium RIFCSPHIGHO2_01_FULL_39_12c]|uniref:GIY-YIG domain-containing protein n=1 Tax=Candidatus Roizmanbacteria bacterium RIFCSPHIGHO2_01_FULL_39_12c TaxID=1802031 RepID=A0A1F7GCJ8_9BACT|nr:MAG: hypothetical protein A2774_03145 [Candidatus Roizmanbacteria bacterium RIFCSPHIGHO2_01_FULL_39_12c]